MQARNIAPQAFPMQGVLPPPRENEQVDSNADKVAAHTDTRGRLLASTSLGSQQGGPLAYLQDTYLVLFAVCLRTACGSPRRLTSLRPSLDVCSCSTFITVLYSKIMIKMCPLHYSLAVTERVLSLGQECANVR